MSRKFWIVFAYELRRNIRRAGYLFSSFGLPLLLIAALFIYQAIALDQLRNAPLTPPPVMPVNAADADIGVEIEKAGVVDLAGLNIVIPDGYAEMLVGLPTLAQAEAQAGSGEIDMFYVIQPDYLETGAVQLVLPSLSLAQISRSPLDAVLVATLGQSAPAQVQARIAEPAVFRITNTQLSTIGAGSEDDVMSSALIVVYVFAGALTFSLLITNGYLMQTVIEEKETRLVEILVASVKPGDLLGGKILAMGLLGLLQVVAWVVILFATIAVAAGSELRQTIGLFAALANIEIAASTLPLLALYFVLAYLLFAGLYAIVSALSNSMREGPQYAVFFTIPALLPLYFVTTYTSDPNGTLAVVTSLIPITAPMAMVIRLALTEVPPLQVVVGLALLSVTVVGVMWLAGRVFRVGVLLAGQVPKLRDLPMLIRG